MKKKQGRPKQQPLDLAGIPDVCIAQAALMAVPDPMSILDRDFRIVWANRARLAGHGKSLEEVRGHLCYEVFHGKSDLCQGCPAPETFRTGKPCTHECPAEAPGRTGEWSEIHTWPILDGPGTVAYVVEYAPGTTGRRQASEVLSWEAELNGAVAQIYTALGSLISTDDVSSLVLGHAKRLTRSELGFVGYVDHTTGHLFFPTITPDMWDSCPIEDKDLIFRKLHGIEGRLPGKPETIVVNAVEGAVAASRISPGHVPIRRLLSVPVMMGEMLIGQVTLANSDRDYGEQDLLLVEHLAAIYAIAIQRKQALDAVVKCKEDWERTFDAISDMVLLLDKDHRILLTNRAATSGLEGRQDSLCGKKCCEAVHASRQPPKGCSLLKTTRTLSPTTQEITEPRMGKTFICSASPVFDHGESVAGYTIALKDITESKHLQAQLIHAEKMTAIGTLAGGIAHDFNNILQAMSGYTQLLLMKKTPADPDYRYLDQIDESAQRAAGLIQRLLLFSRKVESKLRPLNLNHEVQQIQGLLERMIPKMIAIETRLAPDLKSINGDAVQLQQVMMNIALNARDAMPDGGRLSFETENVLLDAEYCRMHLKAAPGSYVRLSVSDTGVGMDQKILERIFEPFFTTKETGKGTGLGLSMVYGIVKAHGGHITCSSEPGRGTIFRLNFPVLKKTRTAAELSKDERPPEMHGGTETILLVDDDESLLDIGKSVFEQHGYEVLTVRNGEQALEVYGREEGRIDLVILDIGMPGMGGRKCMKELFSMNPEIKLIMASGYAEDGELKKLLSPHRSAFLAKPYRLATMLRTVREVLDRS